MKNTLSKMSQAEKVLVVVLLLSVSYLSKVAYVKATSETLVKVDPYVSSEPIGETFTVNITVVNVQNLYGVEVALYWNASILQVVGVDVRLGVESYSDGVLYEGTQGIFIAQNKTVQEGGKYLLAGTSMDPAPPFDGSGNIVRITFTVAAIGNCMLHLETKLADWPPPDRKPRISWPINHTTNDGFFEIPEFPPIIILALFIILSTFTVILSKKRFSIKLRR